MSKAVLFVHRHLHRGNYYVIIIDIILKIETIKGEKYPWTTCQGKYIILPLFGIRIVILKSLLAQEPGRNQNTKIKMLPMFTICLQNMWDLPCLLQLLILL